MARGRWKETENLIKKIQEVLIEEYPVTLRQLFYRLVSKLVLQNNRASYQKLSRVLTDARNNGEVPFDRIVDRSKVEYRSSAWEDLEGYLEATARDYRKDRWQDQTYHLELWTEKDALTGYLWGVCSKYGVPLTAHRGFGSTTKKHELGQKFLRLNGINKPVVILYVGDFDPSGIDIERDLAEKLQRYGAYDYEVVRLAILKEDIEKFNLPPHRVKDSDPRAKGFKARHGKDTVEADALPPNELRSRIENAILRYIDVETWNRSIEVEEAELEDIRHIVSVWQAGRFR